LLKNRAIKLAAQTVLIGWQLFPAPANVATSDRQRIAPYQFRPSA
jgi:hypothetical protein